MMVRVLIILLSLYVLREVSRRIYWKVSNWWFWRQQAKKHGVRLVKWKNVGSEVLEAGEIGVLDGVQVISFDHEEWWASKRWYEKFWFRFRGYWLNDQFCSWF